MIVRSATVHDKDAIVKLLCQLDYPVTEDLVAQQIGRLLAHPDALLLVAEDGAQVQGFISLHFIPQLPLEGDFCRISYFCVGDGARSAGVGRRLEAAAVEAATARNCDRIEVHCHARRTRAHEFYARQGFEESPKYLMKRLRPASR